MEEYSCAFDAYSRSMPLHLPDACHLIFFELVELRPHQEPLMPETYMEEEDTSLPNYPFLPGNGGPTPSTSGAVWPDLPSNFMMSIPPEVSPDVSRPNLIL